MDSGASNWVNPATGPASSRCSGMVTCPKWGKCDSNGTIEKKEVIEAIKDYLFGEGDEAISKGDVIKLIKLYLFG